MRRVRLGTLLIGLNTGLVLLAVLCVSIAGVRLLRRLGDEQALARVSLAGTNALQAVERSARDVAVSAHLLAERPTVGRLLGQRDTRGLTAFLDSFRRTSQLSGSAVVSGPSGLRGPDGAPVALVETSLPTAPVASSATCSGSPSWSWPWRAVRIEAGHASLRRSSVALDEVVEEAVELTAPLLAQRGQRLEVDLPTGRRPWRPGTLRWTWNGRR